MDRLNLIRVRDELARRNLFIFTPLDLTRLFEVKPKTIRAFLSYHCKSGAFTRIKSGIYISTNNPPTKFEIANALYTPSYISFETALSYWGILPETVYSVISATTKPGKEFEVDGQSYTYYKIKRSLYFGYWPLKLRGRVVLLADKEKSLLDYLYRLSLKGKPVNDRIDLSDIDKKKLKNYLSSFRLNLRKSRVLIKAVKNLNL